MYGVIHRSDLKLPPQSFGRSLTFQHTRRLRTLAVSRAITPDWDDHQSTYNVSMNSKLPALFGGRALTLEFKVRQFAICWSRLSFMHGVIALHNAVRGEMIDSRREKAGGPYV